MNRAICEYGKMFEIYNKNLTNPDIPYEIRNNTV